MRKVSLTAAAAALALAGALVGVGVASAAHSSPRTSASVTVVPSTGLANDQTVTVSGAGYNPGESLAIVQCSASPTSLTDCNVGTYVATAADSSGNLPATSFKVTTGIYGTTTCGTSSSDLANCIIEVGDLTTQAPLASTPITFAAPGSTTTTTTTAPGSTTTTTTVAPTTTTTAPASSGPRRVKATPSTNLRGGQKVVVTGSGFTPGDHVFIIECLRTASGQKGCNLATLKAVTVKSSGALPSTKFKVVTGKVGTGKCGTSAATRNKCDISVGNASGKDAARTSISFKR